MKSIDGMEWYSREELFVEVRRRGLVIYDSLFEEWQKYGVMSKSQREGRGRKKGVSGWWSRQQLELLCTLCRVKQGQKLTSVAPQCNIPVWVWMYWGEGHGVSLEQVKRAMKTWVGRRYPARVKEARASARQLVRLVANDEGYGTREAQRCVEEWLLSGTGRVEALADSLAHAYDPWQLIVEVQAHLPEASKDALGFPLAKAIIDGGAGTQFAGQSIPLNTGSQDVHDGCKHLSIISSWPSSFGMRRPSRYQRTDVFPQFIADALSDVFEPSACFTSLGFLFIVPAGFRISS